MDHRMEKKSKQDLISIIREKESHQATLERRLRDVVHAYKSLVKEKDALEATVKAFSLRIKSSDNGPKNKSSQESSHGKDKREQGGGGVSDPLGVSEGKNEELQTESKSGNVCANKCCQEQEELLERLQLQIDTLSTSLTTVMEEKSKMESIYQGDKKVMMQEHETKMKESHAKMSKLQEEGEYATEQLKQLKNYVRQQQQEREEEQSNHAAMLKEMQQLLTVERIEKEELRAQLIERDRATQILSDDKSRLYEDQIKTLSKDLEKMSVRLKHSEQLASEPNPLLVELSAQMKETKKQHEDALASERKRANDAEEKLLAFSIVEEKRIAELETKLAELSEIVGDYDRMRQQDQIVITKLKERLGQLDAQHAIPAPQTTPSPSEVGAEDNRSVNDLQDQVSKLKSILKISLKKGDLPGTEVFNVAEIEELLRNDPTHKVCQAEYRQLKEEFEHYKLTIKSRLQSDTSKETRDVSNLNKKIAELQSELNELSRYIDDKEKDNMQIVARLQCEVTNAEEKRRQELSAAQDHYKLQLAAYDNQLKMQRDRTEHLLEEKENDIKRLKEKLSLVAGTPSKEIYVPRSLSEQPSTDVGQDVELSQLFERQMSSASEGSLLHYSQKMAKLEEELVDHRKAKYELEFALRDGEHREEQLLHQMNLLKEEIRKLERDRSRESSNLEYLKNIIMRYITSNSVSVRTQMTNALSMVLQLSPTEIAEIRKQQTGWWSS